MASNTARRKANKATPSAAQEKKVQHVIAVTLLDDWLPIDKVATKLRLSSTRKAILRRNLATWDGSIRDFEAELARSESVSEDDLAIRINVRDYD